MDKGNIVFLNLAIIIASAKLFGMIARKLHAPQVVGEIIAGLIIGPSVLNIVSGSDFLSTMAEIGVVLLMFEAGLETDLKKLAESGPVATLIACFGVAALAIAIYLKALDKKRDLGLEKPNIVEDEK